MYLNLMFINPRPPRRRPPPLQKILDPRLISLKNTEPEQYFEGVGLAAWGGGATFLYYVFIVCIFTCI